MSLGYSATPNRPDLLFGGLNKIVPAPYLNWPPNSRFPKEPSFNLGKNVMESISLKLTEKLEKLKSNKGPLNR